MAVGARVALCPQVEQGVGNKQHRQKHADPRAHHQRELPKGIDQQIKLQHQSKAEGEKAIISSLSTKATEIDSQITQNQKRNNS